MRLYQHKLYFSMIGVGKPYNFGKGFKLMGAWGDMS